jgi:hypothetical protein
VELIFDVQKPDTFVKFLPELGDSPAKVLKTYTKTKEKASKWNSRRKLGKSRWTSKKNYKVFVKTQPMSDAIKGTTS